MPVEEEDGKGGKRRANRAMKERKGTPQGAPISPLPSNICMRRFILGWKVPGYARNFQAEIVNCADDFCVIGKASASAMTEAVCRIMRKLKPPVNAQKTGCPGCPEEPLEFLGYRIGWNDRYQDGSRDVGTRPGKASVPDICRKIGEHVDEHSTPRTAKEVAGKLNQMLVGWGNYFDLGQVGPACEGIDAHAIKRLRQWFWRKHKVKSRSCVQFTDERPRNQYGLTTTTKDPPWAKT